MRRGPQHSEHRRLLANRATLARSQGILFAGAGLLGFVGVLLPHPPTFDEVGLVSVQAIAVISGAAMVLAARHVPRFMLSAVPLAGTLTNSFAVAFSNDPTSAYALFYLWVGFYAVYFLRPRYAFMQIAWVAVNYGAVILLVHAPPASPPYNAVHFLVIIAGTLLIATFMLMSLRSDVEALIGRLSEAARIDALTGLANRRAFREALEAELGRARRSAGPVGLLVLDLDRFKQLNDRKGHEAGDRVLRSLPAAISAHLEPQDLIFRTGGEEFAVLLPERDADAAYGVADRLVRAIRGACPDLGTPLSTSIGVAAFPAHAETGDALQQLADEALYAAKALGRDRAVLYSSEVTSVIHGIAGRHTIAEQSHLATLLALAEAMDLRDPWTARHSRTVGRYAELMARALELPDDRVERIRIAGILHDVGKIAVSDKVLRKEGPLDEDERADVRQHPETAARILASPLLADIREWVLAHHERPDGRGFPFGLTADEIPLEASIVSVADAFEAMTSDRPYRPRMTEEAAVQELRRGAGTQFDPTVVEALERVLSAAAAQGNEPLTPE